jgi:hypothetical protein
MERTVSSFKSDFLQQFTAGVFHSNRFAAPSPLPRDVSGLFLGLGALPPLFFCNSTQFYSHVGLIFSGASLHSSLLRSERVLSI